MARAGIWYTNHIWMEDAAIEAPKNFRRCKDLILKDVTFANAAETLWSCSNVTMENVTAKGDYFAMNSENLTVSGRPFTATIPLMARKTWSSKTPGSFPRTLSGTAETSPSGTPSSPAISGLER